ncbi:hypothetical protein N9J42_00955 [bacterium]|nr:hypothetical protein [bacterium]
MDNFNLKKFLIENRINSDSANTYTPTNRLLKTVNISGATPQQLALIKWEGESAGFAFPIHTDNPKYDFQFYADEIMKLNSEEEVRDYYKNKRKESHSKEIDGEVKYFDGLDNYGDRWPISRAVKIWKKASKPVKPVPQPETGDPKYLKVAKKLTDMYKSTPQGRKIIMGTKPFRKDGTDDVQALILSADQYLEYFEERGDEDGVEIANYFLNSLGDLAEGKLIKEEAYKNSKLNNFDLRKFLTENKLTSNSKLLKEAVMWNWDGDRNSLEEVPPKFKAAVKAAIGDELDNDTFEEAFDGIKNFHADEAGKGEQTFNSDHWAEQIEMDHLNEYNR